MLIVISLKNIEKMFFIPKCSYLSFKKGSKVIKAIIGAFLQTVFLFFSGPTTRWFFLTLKRVEVFQKAYINMFIIKGTPLEAFFYGFYKDKHRKFCAIMTEILAHSG